MSNGLFESLSASALTALIALGLPGCQGQNTASPESSIMVRVTASQTQCGQQQPGLALALGATDIASDNDRVASAMEQALAEGLAALRVNLGRKPTPGYSAELEEARQEGDSLILQMSSTEPAPDAMLAQVITTPCVVLEVPASGWNHLEVRLDAEGFPLGLEHPNPG